MRIKHGETVVTLAVSHSESMRTTVPAHVIDQLQLRPKDRVKWSMDKIDGVWVATIRKSSGDD